MPIMPTEHGHKQHGLAGVRGVRGGQDDGRAHRGGGVRLRRGHGAWRRWGMRDVPGRPLQGSEHRQVREQRVRELQQLRGGAAGRHRVQQHARRHVPGVPGQQLVVHRKNSAGALLLQRLLRAIDRPFIVLAETKPSKRHIPVWARYSPLRTRVEAHANTLSP